MKSWLVVLFLVLIMLSGLKVENPYTPKKDAIHAEKWATEVERVTKSNFLSHFQLGGTSTYDSTSGVITLTPGKRSQAGNVTLKNKLIEGKILF